MTTVRLVVAAALLVLSTVPIDVSAQASGVDYALIIDCGAAVPVGQPGTPATAGGGGCPIRAVDSDDIMGDPSIAVDPLKSEEMILASLHGCVRDATCALGGNCPSVTPTDRARCGQVFTTFTTTNQGQSWVDNPFVPPDDIGNNAFGIHPQVTIDPYGQVYVGSLYAIPSGSDDHGNATYDSVIAAQKFETIDTIDEEQRSSNGGYNAEYLTPVFEGNQIDQMWFLFNPVTDNMTMVWRETVPKPPVPPCDTDSSYLVNATGYYAKVDAIAQDAAVYHESNGIPDLQTPLSCPLNPDERFAVPAPATDAAAAVPVESLQATSPMMGAPAPARTMARSSTPIPPAALAPYVMQPNQTSNSTTNSTSGSSSSSSSSSTSSTQTGSQHAKKAKDDEQVGAIGVVWTTADSDTPYYYQPSKNVIKPCSASTNPVISYGWLYIGCIVDTSQGEFRWAPDVENGTVQLFRLDPNGGVPEYMGQAPETVGRPRLGVRSDGRLALIGAGASPEGALKVTAAFGQYDPGKGRIEWSSKVSVGQDILPFDPAALIVRADIQDMIYREQSGALHFIVKTTTNYVAGIEDIQDGLGVVPHISKFIVAIDERYGVLATLPIPTFGDAIARHDDATIASAPEAAFQDLTDDFLQLPAAPYVYQGKQMGPLYQREFFAIADYGTVLFAEIVEQTDVVAPALSLPPTPPPPVPAAATTNLIAPVAGVAGIGAVMGTLVAHRRKHPLAAITKGE